MESASAASFPITICSGAEEEEEEEDDERKGGFGRWERKEDKDILCFIKEEEEVKEE